MKIKNISLLAILLLILFLSCNETSPTSVEDKEAPTISIINPPSNSEWDDGSVLLIKAQADDNELVVKTELYIDGNLVFTNDTSEFSYSWNTLGKKGSHQLLAKAYDANTNMGQSEIISVKILNESPNASFSITPSGGDTTMVYHFDASASTDKEDAVAELQVRWDWESDGIWDTDYSTNKTADHKYTNDGTMRILLEVKDKDEQTDTTSIQIILDSVDPGTVTDIDGNIYNTVKIGDQWWMVENLRVTHYRDGFLIPLIYINSSWAVTTKGAYCYYNNDPTNTAKFGLLYNFHAVDNSKELAPSGWHVASDEEWKEMEMYLGMTQEQVDGTLWRGTDEGGKLKETGTMHWNTPNTGATNETGFTALPAGYRNGGNGTYGGLEIIGSFWTSTGTTASNSTYALGRALTNTESRINKSGSKRSWGQSVRCIKD